MVTMLETKYNLKIKFILIRFGTKSINIFVPMKCIMDGAEPRVGKLV